jgi:hypothetical protein
MSDTSVNQLATIYLKIRDERDKIKTAYEEEDKKLAEQMAVVEAEMLEVFRDTESTSIKTPAGTVMRRVATRYWTNDWDSMYNFIRDNDAYGLLERRIHQTNMKQFIEENPDVFPPGMLVDSQFKITVRRGKND